MAIIQKPFFETIHKEPLPIADKPIRAFLFACTNKSESECLCRNLFGTEKFYGPIVIRIRKGDLLFLNNLDTDTLHGVFQAVSDGGVNIERDAFNGRYPYQVKIEPIGEKIALKQAKKFLTIFGFKRNTPLFKKGLVDFLNAFSSTSSTNNNVLSEIVNKVKKNRQRQDVESEIPLIESTTLWDFPKQSYGITLKGNNRYAGVTPALIIYNLIWRYTEPGDLVVDPMCGSGTTIDVSKAEKREVFGYDIASTRPDIIQGDARNIILPDDFVDLVFVDSPYGDNIRYNKHPDNIGTLSSESEQFYDELEKVMIECHRILKEGKVLGWLIGDQWVRKVFTPVGLKIYEKLCKHFEPLDIVCVTRRGQSSNTDVWHNRARRFNFYLRGFKYLIIVRKTNQKNNLLKPRKIDWAYYDRGNGGR